MSKIVYYSLGLEDALEIECPDYLQATLDIILKKCEIKKYQPIKRTVIVTLNEFKNLKKGSK